MKLFCHMPTQITLFRDSHEDSPPRQSHHAVMPIDLGLIAIIGFLFKKRKPLLVF
jgi:hypothetical protein